MRFKGDPFIEGNLSKKDKPVPKGYDWYKHLGLPKSVAPGDKRTAAKILQVVGDFLAENSRLLTPRQKNTLRSILYRWRRRCRGANPYFNTFGTEPIMKIRTEYGFGGLPRCVLSPEQRTKEESYMQRHDYKRSSGHRKERP
jgi:hypothetical protein